MSAIRFIERCIASTYAKKYTNKYVVEDVSFESDLPTIHSSDNQLTKLIQRLVMNVCQDGTGSASLEMGGSTDEVSFPPLLIFIEN